MKKIILILSVFTISLLSAEEWVQYNDPPKGAYAFTETRLAVSSWEEGFTETEIIERLGRHPAPDQVLEVSVIDHPLHSAVGARLLQYISDHFPKVWSVSIWNLHVDNEEIKHLNVSFPYLERLSLQLGEGEPLKEGAVTIAKAIENIKFLFITKGSLTDEAFGAFFEHCLHLYGFGYQSHSPELASHSQLTDKSLETLTQYQGKDLRSVGLDGGQFSWDAIKQFLVSKKSVFLSLFYNSNRISESDVVELAQTHPFSFSWSYRDEPYWTNVCDTYKGPPLIRHFNTLPYQGNDDD